MLWRWHFFAGLFCLPFVIMLCVTGLLYLFKPQIETWL
ncbi:PepSY domain-containing protein, partial [Asaia sp. W19]